MPTTTEDYLGALFTDSTIMRDNCFKESQSQMIKVSQGLSLWICVIVHIREADGVEGWSS